LSSSVVEIHSARGIFVSTALSSFDLGRLGRCQLWSGVFRGGWPLWAMCMQRSKPAQPAPLWRGAARTAGAAPVLPASHPPSDCSRVRTDARLCECAPTFMSRQPWDTDMARIVLTGIPFHQLESPGLFARALVSCIDRVYRPDFPNRPAL